MEKFAAVIVAPSFLLAFIGALTNKDNIILFAIFMILLGCFLWLGAICRKIKAGKLKKVKKED